MPSAHREIQVVRAGDRLQHDRAVLGVAAHRADLVERPAGGHHAEAADAAERRSQADDAAADRRRKNRAARIGADRERRPDPRPSPRPDPADDPLDPSRGIPRVVGAAARPLIAERQFARGELGDEHRARVVQPLTTAASSSKVWSLASASRPTASDSPSRR